MKIKYTSWEPKPETYYLVMECEEIIKDYRANGYTLTVRQLYYRLVSKALIENDVRTYKKLVNTLTRARLAGMISWAAIEDRNREFNSFYFQESDQAVIDQLPVMISFEHWERQEAYVEVWVEKEALGNVISRACEPRSVPNMACKGYLSASEAWQAGRRFKKKMSQGKRCHLIHLGDHDPSGIDMTRDNAERLKLFSEFDSGFDDLSIHRLALNHDQIEEHRPPPNPAKSTDSRFKSYEKKYGKSSWELDALEPNVIEEIITEKIESLIDHTEWDHTTELENSVKGVLEKLSSKWPEIKSEIEHEE